RRGQTRTCSRHRPVVVEVRAAAAHRSQTRAAAPGTHRSRNEGDSSSWRGGSGKSSLAAQLVDSDLRRELFPDGVIASECGQSPDVRWILSTWGRALGDRELTSEGYLDRESGRSSVKAFLEKRACLLVLDDVWDVDVVRDWFRVGGPRCALLVTTRNGEIATAIGAELVDVAGLHRDEARHLLERWAGSLPPDSATVDAIIDEVGGLPLALELIGA